jgi:hypothetical protein
MGGEATMRRPKEKCPECGKLLGDSAEDCEPCWHAAMYRADDLRDLEIDRRTDERRGK